MTKNPCKDLDSPDYDLGPIESQPEVVRLGLYSCELPKLEENVKRKLVLSCGACSYQCRSGLPLNSTNLKSHWKNRHNGQLRDLLRRAKHSGLPSEETIASSNVARGVDVSTPSIDGFVNNGSSYRDSGQQASYTIFDPVKFKSLVLHHVMANNLPLAHVDSPSFKSLLEYAKSCKYNKLPSMTRYTIRADLEVLFKDEFERLKEHLAKHKGRFSLTIDEWNSGNNYDFFAVTLHFHNDEFQLENYTIGFEVLNKETSYTGEKLFERLDGVINSYEISDRIISITRDNASPITNSLKIFTEKFNARNPGFEFSGDIRCVGHILNLTTKAFLKYTFFKPMKSEKFLQSLRKLEAEHPTFHKELQMMKDLPKKMKSIIRGVRFNHFLKNSFRTLIEEQRSDGKRSGPEILVNDNDTRWLSTYNMIDRFLFFKEEIEQLLKQAEFQPNRDRFGLRDFRITAFEWTYLIDIRNILEIFLQPTKKLQGHNYETSNLTIPFVSTILKELDKWKQKGFESTNPYIALGIEDACDKLREYYPIDNEEIEPLKSLYLATVLDPRLKFAFEELNFPNSVINAVRKYFQVVYDRYRREYTSGKYSSVREDKRSRSSDRTGESGQSSTQMHEFFTYTKSTLSDGEVSLYLGENRENGHCSIREFYETRKSSFPIIRLMAKDFLSIMAMSAPAESLFSKVKSIVTEKRNRLLPSTIRMLAILKSRGRIRDEMGMNFDSCEDYREDPDMQSITLSELNLNEDKESEEMGILGAGPEIETDDEENFNEAVMTSPPC
ncbi:hypothetical protein OXX80_002541 [Metschnikowia pulcherrima]